MRKRFPIYAAMEHERMMTGKPVKIENWRYIKTVDGEMLVFLYNINTSQPNFRRQHRYAIWLGDEPQGGGIIGYS